MLFYLLLLLLLTSCLSFNVNNYQHQYKLKNNLIMKTDTTIISDAVKESKITPLYLASKVSALGLVAKEIPNLLSQKDIVQSSLIISSYMAAAITASTLESASKRTRLTGTTFKTLNFALTTASKFSLVISGVALLRYPLTKALKINYWLIILQSLLTISPCMKALKLGDKSFFKSPKISGNFLGTAYLASSIHFFIQGFKNLFLSQTAFPVPYYSYGLFLIPAALLTLHDAANNERLNSTTYKTLNFMVLLFSSIKAISAYSTIGFIININFIADVASAFFSLVGLATQK